MDVRVFLGGPRAGRIGGEYATAEWLFRRFRGVARGASHASAAARR
jgi:hypothetical protein